MAKREVCITFEVDASEYQGCDDTPEEVFSLVVDMICGNAYFPLSVIVLHCGGLTRRITPG